jgi:hypothetical protein
VCSWCVAGVSIRCTQVEVWLDAVIVCISYCMSYSPCNDSFDKFTNPRFIFENSCSVTVFCNCLDLQSQLKVCGVKLKSYNIHRMCICMYIVCVCLTVIVCMMYCMCVYFDQVDASYYHGPSRCVVLSSTKLMRRTTIDQIETSYHLSS